MCDCGVIVWNDSVIGVVVVSCGKCWIRFVSVVDGDKHEVSHEGGSKTVRVSD